MGSALAGGLLDAKWCEPGELALLARSVENRASSRSVSRIRASSRRSNRLTSTPTPAPSSPSSPTTPKGFRVSRAPSGVTRMLSVVAGLSTARLEACFPGPAAVIRSMPNTPVLIRQGVTAMAGGAHVTSADLDWAESILGAVGTVVRVTEKNIDAVTGLSGPDARLPLLRRRSAHRGGRAPRAASRSGAHARRRHRLPGRARC